MSLFKLSYIEVCDPNLSRIVEAVRIDRAPPSGSLGTETVQSERSKHDEGCRTSSYITRDVRVLTMNQTLLDMYSTTPSQSGAKYVNRHHLAGLVTNMTANGWVFESRKHLDPQTLWVSY